MKKIFLTTASLICCLCFCVAQHCGNCQKKPTVVYFDLEKFNIQKPAVKALHKKWEKIYFISDYIFEQIQNGNNCISLLDAAPMERPRIGRQAEASYGWEYLIYGWIRPKDDNYELKLFLSPACKDKILAETDVLFKLSADWNPVQTAQGAAAKLFPIINKIKSFEAEQKHARKLPLGGNWYGGFIDIKVIDPHVKSGAQTDIVLEMKDCDGRLLADQEIIFSKTTGGTVIPATVKTDARGKAKAKFNLQSDLKGEAIIVAQSSPVNVKGCEDLYFGTAAVAVTPAYHVSVFYTKSGMTDVRMIGEDPIMSITMADERRNYSVAASTIFYHYPTSSKSKNYNVQISPDESSGSKTVFIQNEGNSHRYEIIRSPEIKVNPLDAHHKVAKDSIVSISSSNLLLPWVAMEFRNDTVYNFEINFDFEEKEDHPVPESGALRWIRGDSTAIVETIKINDPDSPYKTEQVIAYFKQTNDKNNAGLGRETEGAIVRILIKK